MARARAAGAAVAAPAAATALALALPGGGTTAASVYLLGVVGASWVGGLWSGLAAAILSFVGLNYFFTEPRHTLSVATPGGFVALFVFLAVAAAAGGLIDRVVRERTRAERRERQQAILARISGILTGRKPMGRLAAEIAEALVDVFGLRRCEIRLAGESPVVAGLDRAGEARGDVADPVEVPLPGAVSDVGEMRLEASQDATLSADDLALLRTIGRQVGLRADAVALDSRAREAGEAARTSELRAALLASVTHDLKTPLASIKACATTLRSTAPVDADQRADLLSTIVEEADRLDRLVTNVVDLARLRAGALEPQRLLVAADEVVESVLVRLRRRLEPFSVRVLVSDDLPPVLADPVQLDQVITNLVENAARFAPPGSEIMLSVRTLGDVLQVRVVDHGPGIAREDRDRAFQEFQRRDRGAGRAGTGLGLAIAKAMISVHGGRIWLQDTPGGGTTVVFELPLRLTERLPS